MKIETKRKKQLETVKKWLSQTREYYYRHDSPKFVGYFTLLIAMEQLVEYLEMENLQSSMKKYTSKIISDMLCGCHCHHVEIKPLPCFEIKKHQLKCKHCYSGELNETNITI